MTKSRGILASRRYWTADELRQLRECYPDTRTDELAAALGRPPASVYNQANSLGMRKSAAFLASEAAGRIQRGRTDPRMVATQFKAGQEAWNKGQSYRPGGRAAETQFKPGRPAHEAHNYKPIGSLRLSKDGYLERKVTDDPAVVPARRWIGVHRLVWEAEHGPVPAGHVVVFMPGRRTTVQAEITLDAVELITRRELMERNTVHNYPREIARLVQLRGALARQINWKESA